MSAKDTVQAGLKAWESNDAGKMSSLVADDFVLTGPVPQPLGKNEFVGLMQAVMTAMSDWAFNITDVQEDGEKVTLKSHITGTHTGTLQLPGLPSIPATSKKIALPEESHTYIIRDGKLHSLTVDSRPDGGIPGMLTQIGFAIPNA